jgi:DNA-binding NtrC family response regulator
LPSYEPWGRNAVDMLNVLVVDDQASVRTALDVLFELHSIPVMTASTPEEALELVAREDIGLVIQDMNFRRDTTSGEEGVELMRAIRKLDPDLPIVLITAYTSLEMAVQLVKEGANDYIAKPWNDDKLVTTAKNLLRMRELQQQNLRLTWRGLRARRELKSRHDLCGLLYESAQMHDVVSLAVKVAPANVAVMITGPNGSGKEKVAEIVYANSRRRNKPFIRVNSGGLHDNLIDAELFGAEPGAFTGSVKTRIGRFEEADGGTLFLDEIGNLSAGAQMKLLRVLQTGEFQRLGSNVTRKADVRVISATNANLPRAIEEGTFREDLYFRLNVFEIVLPPLRERSDDILPLARLFLEVAANTEGVSVPVLSPEAEQLILGYEWPGNVRELENRAKRAFLVRSSDTIRGEDVGLNASPNPNLVATVSTPPAALDRTASAPARDPEYAEIEAALVEARGVVSRAAAQLGISRQALYRRMERLGIELERRPKS